MLPFALLVSFLYACLKNPQNVCAASNWPQTFKNIYYQLLLSHFAGNLAVMVTVFGWIGSDKVTYIFLSNLALGDFLVIICCLPLKVRCFHNLKIISTLFVFLWCMLLSELYFFPCHKEHVCSCMNICWGSGLTAMNFACLWHFYSTLPWLYQCLCKQLWLWKGRKPIFFGNNLRKFGNLIIEAFQMVMSFVAGT